MAGYSNLFLVGLMAFCVTIFGLFRKPLYAAAYLVWFRSSFAIAAYLQISLISGIPYFTLAYVCLCMVLVLYFAFVSAKIPNTGPVLTLYIFSIFILLNSVYFLLFEPSKSADIIANILKFILPISVYLAAYAGLKTAKDLNKLSYMVAVIIALPVLVGIIQALTGVSYNYANDSFVAGIRPVGTIIDANAYGIFLCMGAFLITPFALMRRRFGMKVVLATIVISILLSKNRGSWIAAVIAVIAAVAIFHRRINLPRVLVAALVLGVVAYPVVVKRFSDLSGTDQFGQSQDTFSERVQQTQHLLSEAALSPIVGYGAGTAEQPWGASHLARPPHNDYIRVLYEFGLPIAVLYVLFLLSQLYIAAGMGRDRTWLYGFSSTMFIIYMMIISATQNLIFDTTTYAMVMLMLAVMHRVRATNGFAES